MRIRAVICLLVAVLFACLEAVAARDSASEPAGDIRGYWIMPSGDAVVEISALKSGEDEDELVVTLHRTLRPEVDERNPDAELRARTLQGIVLGTGFRAKGREWSGGKIYDPGTGKTYRAKMSLLDDDHLQLRGYIGVPALGRTQVLIRLGAYVAWFDAMVGGAQ